MKKTYEIILDEYEQEIEDGFEKQVVIKDDALIDKLRRAASEHIARRKSVTLRIPKQDLEIIRIKASKLGLPYQTYINMLIHKDASKL